MNNELKSWSRRVAAGLSALLMLLPLAAMAEVNLESETILRVLERDTVQKQDAQVLPIYEYLRGNIGSSEDVVSFHLSGWGRIDLADEGYYSDDTAGELMYGYVEVRPSGYNVNLRAGRQYVFQGVANEAFDGVSVGGEMKGGLLLSAYTGLPVGLSTTNGSEDDLLYGGRVAHRGSIHQVGLSYKLVENNSLTAQEMVGSDLALFLPGGLNLFGVSRYNLETEDFSEHSYEANFKLAGFSFRPFVERYRYEDYFNAGDKTANPFRFLAVQDETLTVGGVDVIWHPVDNTDITFRGKSLDYDQADTAAYVSLGLSQHGDGATSFGAELGRLEGDLNRDSYTMAHMFAYLEEFNDKFPLEFISADLMLAIYDEDIRGEGEAYYATLGTGKHFLDGALRLKAAAEYSSDPYYTEDVRGSLSATYLFAP